MGGYVTWTGILSLVALLAASAGNAPLAHAQAGPRVVIVGAGISGLAAARRLHDAGFTDVTLLEARDRLGGRVSTDRTSWGGTTLELGAAWLHGYHPEILGLADEAGLGPGDMVNSNFYNMLMHTSSHEKKDLYCYADDLEVVFGGASVLTALLSPNKSVAAMIDEMVANELIIDPNPGDGLVIEESNTELLSFVTTAFYETELGADARSIPARGFQEWIAGFLAQPTEVDDPSVSIETFGRRNTAFPGGYDWLVDHLWRGTDGDPLTVELNTVVSEVDYSQDTVRVVTNRGDFFADVVIVTVPVGVLKRGDITFSPALPANKRGAIARMGVGILNKVFLEFEEPFWDLQDVGTCTDKKIDEGTELEYDSFGYSQPQPGGFAVWVNMQKTLNRPVLMAFVSGTTARTNDPLPDQMIAAAAMERLRAYYGRQIPDPIRIMATHWFSDPYARGAYAYHGPNTRLGDRAILRAPVRGPAWPFLPRRDRVLFAGEATVDFKFAQVPGAYASGIREADRILEAYGAAP